MGKARPTCDDPMYRVVELELVMSAAVGVFDALEQIDGTDAKSKRVRSLLADALLEMRQAGIPVPEIEVRDTPREAP